MHDIQNKGGARVDTEWNDMTVDMKVDQKDDDTEQRDRARTRAACNESPLGNQSLEFLATECHVLGFFFFLIHM